MTDPARQKIVEYWLSYGKLDGSERGEKVTYYEGKYWKMMRDFIGHPDVHYIERVTSWWEYDELVDREFEDLWDSREAEE
jgi:hypothetical protein|tara:strand:- start:27 stop:266 length:240 start_codon:yes stop_codon:yes gene_type:complete